MNIQTFTHLFAITLSLLTACSVLLHDTNVDKAMIKSISEQSDSVMRPGSMPHTHSEHASVQKAVRNLKSAHPRIRVRNGDDRNKYVQAKPSARGHHPFDNYTLPIVG